MGHNAPRFNFTLDSGHGSETRFIAAASPEPVCSADPVSQEGGR